MLCKCCSSNFLFVRVKVDVYSFGVLLCEICILEQPDPDKRVAQVAMVRDSMLRVLIRRCLREDPEERPTMEDIIDELEKIENLKEAY